MTLEAPTTIGGIYAPPQIRLRVRPVPRKQHDLRAAEGILLSVVIGTACIAWTVALIRWLA